MDTSYFRRPVSCKGGRFVNSLNSSANRKSENFRTKPFVRFADLTKMCHFADLGFVNPIFFFRFADSNVASRLRPRRLRRSKKAYFLFLIVFCFVSLLTKAKLNVTYFLALFFFKPKIKLVFASFSHNIFCFRAVSLLKN